MSVLAFGGKRNGEEGDSSDPKKRRQANEYTWRDWLEAVDPTLPSLPIPPGDEQDREKEEKYRKKRKKNLQTFIFSLFSKLFPDWNVKYPTRIVKSRSVRHETRVALVRMAVNLVPLLRVKNETEYQGDFVKKAVSIFSYGNEPDALREACDYLRRAEASLENARPPAQPEQAPALEPTVWTSKSFSGWLDVLRAAALGNLSAKEANNANNLRAGINAAALLVEAGVLGPAPARGSAADYAYSWVAAATARLQRSLARGAREMGNMKYVFETCKQPACAKGLQPVRNSVVKELKAAYAECGLDAKLVFARAARLAAPHAAREPEAPSQRERGISDRLHQEGVNDLPSGALSQSRPTERGERWVADQPFSLLPNAPEGLLLNHPGRGKKCGPENLGCGNSWLTLTQYAFKKDPGWSKLNRKIRERVKVEELLGVRGMHAHVESAYANAALRFLKNFGANLQGKYKNISKVMEAVHKGQEPAFRTELERFLRSTQETCGNIVSCVLAAPLPPAEAHAGAGRGQTPAGDADGLPVELLLDDFDFDDLDFEQLGEVELPERFDLATAPTSAPPRNPSQIEPPGAATSLEHQGFVGEMQRLAL
jgi:hypothetical protein